MGFLTWTTQRLFGGQQNVADRLRTVFTPCRHGDGNRTVTIRVFDKHRFLTEMATPNDVVTEMENFLNGMATSAGLEAAVAAQLSTITFHVTYATTMPNQHEIDNLSTNDFPIYLLTPLGLTNSSSEDVVTLLVNHRIPERTWVARRQGSAPVLSPVNTYKTIEEDWKDEPKVLGFGLPGTYFITNSQTRCRKIGIIKMKGFMTENLPAAFFKRKILSVLEHELGHMFGLVHEDNTLMDANYDVNANFTHYTNDQLWVVSRALESLMQN